MKQHYKDLIAWQKAMDLVVDIYEQTQRFPREELYGLVTQMRRAAVSIPSNIAEGQCRLTRGEFRQFLGHARGSIGELHTQVLIAQRLGYLANPAPVIDKLAELSRILNGLLNSLPPGHRCAQHLELRTYN